MEGYRATVFELEKAQSKWQKAFYEELDVLLTAIRNQKMSGVTPVKFNGASVNGVKFTSVQMSTIAQSAGFALSARHYSPDAQAAAVHEVLKDCHTPKQVLNAIQLMLERKQVRKNGECICTLNEQTLRILQKSELVKQKNSGNAVCPLCGHGILPHAVVTTDDEAEAHWQCPRCDAQGTAVYKTSLVAHIHVVDGAGNPMPDYIKED